MCLLENNIGPITMKIVFIQTPMYFVCIVVKGQVFICNAMTLQRVSKYLVSYMYHKFMNRSQIPTNYRHVT